MTPYEENRLKNEDRKNYRKEKIECECGCMISRSDISTHKKTKKHIALMLVNQQV